MKRRNFILNTALYSAAAAFPFIGCSSPDPELDKKLALPKILSQTYDEKTIRDIGTAYGKAYPGEYNMKDLEKLLSTGKDGKTISSSMEQDELNSVLEQQVKDDFNSGRTIILEGMILSVTEARQCALYTLIPQNK